MISSNSNTKTSNLIYVKYELFDHLIYPLSVKLDDNSIIQLFRKLHIMSTIDYKISYKEWVDQATTNLNGFTETEAKVLFSTYKVYASELEPVKTSSIQNSRYERTGDNNDNVDVRYFGLFFSLQLFLQRYKQHSIETRDRDKNPYNFSGGGNSYNNFASPLSSPRGKGASSSRTLSGTAMEYQIIINFIKANIKLFLRLIASDIHNTETSLNSNEFNTLRFFFKFSTGSGSGGSGSNTNSNNNLNTTGHTKGSSHTHMKSNSLTNNNSNNNNNNNSNNNTTLSSIAPFFVNFSTTTKINIDIITEWLNSNIFTYNPNETSLLEIEDLIYLKNLSKCVTIKEASAVQNKNIKIVQCEDSYIYINSNVKNIKIANCNNCTIFVAAVSKITSIDKCENCSICVATNLIKISNTLDSNIYSYTNTQPILFGDNRGVIMGPHNVFYNELPNYLKISKINIDSSYINNFSASILMHDGGENNHSTLNVKDFTQIVVPFKSGGNLSQNSITPKEYIDVVRDREQRVNNIKSFISGSNLQDEQEKALHVAIQGYFREWLVSSGNVKQMTDIVKMIDVPNVNANSNTNLNLNGVNKNILDLGGRDDM